MCGSATSSTMPSSSCRYQDCSSRVVASQRSTRSSCADQLSPSSSSRTGGCGCAMPLLLSGGDPPQHAGVGVCEHAGLLDPGHPEVQHVQAAPVRAERAVDGPLDAGGA